MKVISVKFKENGRAYYFDPGDFSVKEGDFDIVPGAPSAARWSAAPTRCRAFPGK